MGAISPACRRDLWRCEALTRPPRLSAFERGLDRRGELLEVERLLQEHKVFVLGQMLAEGVLGITGDEDDLEVGALAAKLVAERWPVHLGHYHVAHHEIDVAVMALEQLERLGAGRGFEHAV